jgi:hypothetical protein
MSLSGLFFKAAGELAHKLEQATTAVVCDLFENRS